MLIRDWSSGVCSSYLIPQCVLFNALRGIDEPDFVRATNATYKLGIEFIDWVRPGHRYTHPFGFYGLDMMGIDFHHHWLKGRTLGDRPSLDDYEISIVAARAEQFLRPAPDQPQSPRSPLPPTFHLHTSAHALLQPAVPRAGRAKGTPGG